MADRTQKDALIVAWQRANPAQRAVIEQQWNQLHARDPNQSNWANFWSTGGVQTPSILEAAADRSSPATLLMRGIGALNSSPTRRQNFDNLVTQALTGRKPAQAAAATPTGLSLAAPAAAASASAARQPANTAEFLSSMFPGVRITGGDRSPERNAQVGGASRSHHLTSGRAVDMAPIPGKTIQDVANAYRAAGWTVHEALDETKKTNGTGPHWHIAASPPSGGSRTSGGSRPALSAPSPNDLMAYIPTPESVPLINLPDAPQQARPADRPLAELADKNALLAELTAAMQIKPRDTSNDAWERVQAMLQGAAQGAAGSDGVDLGNLILMAGGGALGGFRQERAEQRALTKEEEEAQRQVKIALAKMGYDIDLSNLDTRNQNANTSWQSSEDKRTVDYQNANAIFENTVQEMLTNQGITQGNVNARNQAAMARGQVGAGALQDQYSVSNQAEQLGWQLDKQRELAGAGLGRGAVLPGTRLLLGVGISPERQTGESAEVTNARTAAGLIELGNVNAGLNALANELVLTGRYANEGMLDTDTAKKVEQLVREEKVAAAANLILLKLQEEPGSQQAAVDALANQGSLIATMIKAQQGGRG